MFKFLLKKTIKSKILIIFIVITSISLFSEFLPYFQFFPTTSESDFIKMSRTGGSSDFAKHLSLHDEKTQMNIIKNYYGDILKNDKELSLEEIDIIENKILKSKTVDEFYEADTILFFYAVDNKIESKYEKITEKLELVSGENYMDVNKRIEKSLETTNISTYFAMRYADRLLIIWSLCLFLFITFRFCTLNNNKIKELIYTKHFKSSSYVLKNISVELMVIIVITFIQMLIFAILFDWHVKGVYITNVYDYLEVYLIFIVPSLMIIVAIINFLYYLFESPVVVFPIYYIIESISSKISPELGYTINKTNIILRYDTLFESLSKIEYQTIIMNRINMLILFVMLLPMMIYILDKKRAGKYKIKLFKRRFKNDKAA